MSNHDPQVLPEAPRLARGAARPRSSWRACALFVASTLLCAHTSPSGLEGAGRKLDDTELAEMRGKFIAPSGISYFGLALQSSWQSSDGITTVATLVFNLSFAAGSIGSTHFLVGWTRDCDGCGDPAMDVATANGADTVIPAGLNSVNGVVQSQIINGTDNAARNVMSITVLPAGQAIPNNANGLTEVTSSMSQGFADGDKVEFTIDPGQIAVALSETDGDLVRQSVGSEMNQAAQHVLLNSNLNTVSNGMGITVGLSEMQQADRMQIETALSAMKGHGF